MRTTRLVSMVRHVHTYMHKNRELLTYISVQVTVISNIHTHKHTTEHCLGYRSQKIQVNDTLESFLSSVFVSCMCMHLC